MLQSAPRSSWFTSLARGLSYPWLATAQVRDTFVSLTLLFHYLPGGHVELSLMQKSDQVPSSHIAASLLCIGQHHAMETGAGHFWEYFPMCSSDA